jgi:beta-barrel assembly-enhancing protease
MHKPNIILNSVLAACLLGAGVYAWADGTLTGKPYNPDTLDLHVPADSSNQLPELGDASQMVLSLQDEQRIAAQIMRQVAVSDDVLDDAEITDYLQTLGYRLALSSPDKQQKFNFFVVRDKSINAFAMPGGVIGVHTGLFVAANTESELASVLGHEIGHVTQRHLARVLASQKYDMFKNLAGTAAALLLARSNPQAAAGAMTAASAATVQRQIDYTREHEREADRVGLAILQDAGFDVRGMPAFFTTMQRGTRFYDGNLPSYLRTHPLTSERIADISNRVHNIPYKQVAENLTFHLARAKIRANMGMPLNTLEEFETNVKERRFAIETAERYGLAYAALRNNNINKAQEQMLWLQNNAPTHPFLINLNGAILRAQKQTAQALTVLAAGVKKFPTERGLLYSYLETLLQSNQASKAEQLINEKLTSFSQDAKLYQLLSKASNQQGKVMRQHYALGEAYIRQYDLARALEQMELASKAKDGDFYLQSIVEARLKEFRRMTKDEQLQREAS